jgi:hypothetical protein
MPSTPLLYLNYPHPLQVIRDRKFIVPINIRIERQSGRRRQGRRGNSSVNGFHDKISYPKLNY